MSRDVDYLVNLLLSVTDAAAEGIKSADVLSAIVEFVVDVAHNNAVDGMEKFVVDNIAREILLYSDELLRDKIGSMHVAGGNHFP